MAPSKDTIRPSEQGKRRLDAERRRQKAEQEKKRAAAARKRAQDKARTKPQKDWAAEAVRLEKDAATLRARAKREKAKGSGFDAEYTKGAREAEAKAKAARKRAGITLRKPGATPGASGSWGPASSTDADVGVAAIAKVNQLRAKPAAGRPAGGAVASSGGLSGGAGGGAARGLAAGTGGFTAAAPSGKGVAPGEVDAEFSKRFAHMQWAWGHPELGPVLREAAEKGYNENELTGRLFQTQWFKEHGTANAVAQLREQGSQYLVKMSDDEARRFAMQLISKEVQPAQVAAWMKEQAKSRYPTLAGAIDSGMTVRQYASSYVNDTAEALEIPPEAIDLNDAKWSRFLDGNVDPKTGGRVAMNRHEWLNTIRSDDSYGWRFTKNANDKTYATISYLAQKTGAMA